MIGLQDDLPAERPGHSADERLSETRRQIAGAVAAGLWRTDPAGVPVKLDGIDALRFDPPGTSTATIVHFHGGAYRVGRPEQVALFAAALAVRCGVTVICPRYRLAPEYPFPAALNDALTAVRAVAQSERVIVSGDSAGGGIAASLTARSVAERHPPAGLILLSAWLDLRVSSASYDTNANTDPLFSRDAARIASNLYLQGAAADHPAASPLLGPVQGFPPTFISYGTGEVLSDDSSALAAALTKAGVLVRCQAIAGMDHVAVTRGFGLTGAAETLDSIVAFVAALGIDESNSRGNQPRK